MERSAISTLSVNTLIKVYPQMWERAGLTEDPFDFSAVQNYLEQAERRQILYSTYPYPA